MPPLRSRGRAALGGERVQPRSRTPRPGRRLGASSVRGTLPQVTAVDPEADAAEGESTAPVTGAERALHQLRSELTAALRNGHS